MNWQEYLVEMNDNKELSKAEFNKNLKKWNKKEINKPADTEESQGKEIDGPGYGFSEIEPVGAGKPEYPQDITEGLEVCVIRIVHRHSSH